MAQIVVLLLVCAGARAGEFAERYGVRLAELDKSRPESVCQARDQLRAWLPKAEAADSLDEFNVALTPVGERADRLLRANGWKDGSASAILRRDAVVRRAIGAGLDCGFGIYESEGSFYIGADATQVRALARYLPGDLKAWVYFIQHEGGFADPVEDDNQLHISWAEPGDRLHR